MFDRFCYHHLGTRYVFVDAWAFKRSKWPGDESLQHVSGFDARCVLDAMARGEPALLERLYRAIQGGGPSLAHGSLRRPTTGEDPRVRKVLQALGLDRVSASSPGSAPEFARAYLLRPARPGRPAPVRRDSPESQGIDRALATLGPEPLAFRGDSYRLAHATTSGSVPQRDMLETLSEEQLFSVLRELAADPLRTEPRKAALAELLSLAETERKKTGHTSLLLLRRQRSYVRAVEIGPTITPSQLRKAREGHWVEILLVDKRLGPLADQVFDITLPDGRKQQAASNGQGLFRIDSIPAGSNRILFRPAKDHPPKHADTEWNKLELGITVGTDERHKFEVDHNRAEIVEVDDAQFCVSSSVLAPNDAAQWGLDGLSMVAHALRYASENAARKLMIVGHADQQEGERGSLASGRAKALEALLKGDAQGFAAACTDPNQAATPLLLAWAHERHGYDCDPDAPIATKPDGPEGKPNPVQAALVRFRKAHNQREKTQLDETTQGMVGADYEALFKLFERSLAALLDVKLAELSSVRGKVKFHGVPTLGAGIEWPKPAGAGGTELRSPSSRRVDLMFLESDHPIPSLDATVISAEHFFVDERRVLRAYLPPRVPIVVVTPYTPADIDRGVDAEFKLVGPGYSRAITVSDCAHVVDFFDEKCVELQFNGVPSSGKYKLTTTPKGGAESTVFEGVAFEELLGADEDGEQQ